MHVIVSSVGNKNIEILQFSVILLLRFPLFMTSARVVLPLK